MKRGWIWLLVLCLLSSACGEKSAETQWTAAQMAEAMVAGQTGLEASRWLRSGEEGLKTYLSAVYQVSPNLVEDAAVAAAGGTQASEVAVLILTDEEAAQEVAQALAVYLEAREGDFTGYAPEQAAIASQGKVTVKGRYVALLICADPAAARDTFLRCFDGAAPPEGQDSGDPPQGDAVSPEPPPDLEPDPYAGPEQGPGSVADPAPVPEDPGPVPAPDTPVPEDPPPELGEDAYDAAAVLAAWRSGDSSGLSEKNCAILDGCARVIDEVITEGMTPYEQELAIHDWMIDWAEYDPGALDQAWVEEDPDNDDPYGFLYSGVGICLGYARTFQLFMDMLDIECVTVSGWAAAGTEDHAWNMVRLDGEWYCVDTTWDDPIASYQVSEWAAHTFFNVTSQFLRENDHLWDDAAVEEATGTLYAWSPEA